MVSAHHAAVGLTFLYAPILSMMVFSLNNSRLVTVWDAAHSPTLKWYGELLGNDEILGAAWLSIRIALIAASGAVVLGTLTGVALARFGPFRGRTLMVGMTTAPLVMPEVITGLALLLLFITPTAGDRLAAWHRHGDHHPGAYHLLYRLCGGGRAVAAGRI